MCQVLVQIAEGQRGHRGAGARRRAAHVRQHNDVVHLPELLRDIRFVGNYVEAGAGEPPAGQQLYESLLVHNAAPGDVDQVTVGAECFQHVAADQGRRVFAAGGRHHQHLNGFREVHC